MKDLFFGDTPYQIFNILNILMSSSRNEKPDLVFSHNFSGSHSLLERVKTTGFFERIYEIDNDDKLFRFIPKKVNAWLPIIISKLYLKKVLNFKFDSYNTFYASNLDNNVALAIYSVVDFKSFIVYEDGFGSYVINMLTDHMNKRRLRALKIFHFRKKYFYVDSVLLYKPDLCISEIESVNGLNKLDVMDDTKVLFDVFDFNKESCAYKKIFIIDTVDKQDENRDVIDNSINSLSSTSL
ncbi:hypothetical protein [Ruminococcus albus]|uniref:Uncharacterized protein n=1 Tax=Ruminococcus albus TaxID=1264 RepID=A0A1I1QPF3_RUMAL|nr:hypothetical protein [Ruminococcus albus]SFD23882.1 hypothetical protein SAMN02910406_03460 [Ruminococcus albus]